MRVVMASGAAVLLLLTSACGGMSDDERTASASIAKTFAGEKPSKARLDVGRCVGDIMVSEAGLDQLKKDKVITGRLRASKMVPQQMSTKTAEAYADGIVQCFDFGKLKADIRKQTGASKAEIDAYVSCLDKISDDDLRRAIIDQYTKAKPTKATKKVNTETQACGKRLGA